MVKFKFNLLKGLALAAFVCIWLTSNSQNVKFENDQLYNLGTQIKYFEDKDHSESWQSLVKKTNEFSKNEDEVFSRFATGSSYWFLFEAKNVSNNDVWIDLSNSNLTSVKFYKINNENNVIDSIITGCLEPNGKRPIRATTFILPLIKHGESKSYKFLFEVKTNLPFELPLFAGPMDKVLSNRGNYDFLSVFFIGGIIMMFFYNMFIFFVTKDSIYLYYIGYLLSSIFIVTYASNFPIIALLLGAEIAFNYPATWFWVSFVFTALFSIEYLKLKEKFPLARKILLIEMMGFVVFGIANIFIPTSELSNLYQIAIILFYFTCIGIGYILLLKGDRRAVLYCIGWTILIIGTVVHLMVYNGFLPYNPILRSGTYIGVLFELLIFSIALGNIINNLRLDQSILNEILVKKNNELVDVNTSLDSFNYHVSHDLKTVLNNTKGLVNMVHKYNSIGDNSKVEEITEKLQKVVDNGSETIQSFLSLGTVDTIFKQEITESVNVEEYVFKTIIDNGLEGEIKVDILKNEIGLLPIHAKALESILLNFYTNSIKYNDNFPEAKIGFLKSKDSYVIHYKDNGIGIDMEKYGNTLFEPFRRISNKKKVEGSGVGLFLIKRIVQNYGGKISLQSHLGEGVLFEISFPKKISKED